MTNKNGVSHHSERFKPLKYFLTGNEREKELCDLIGLERLLCPVCGRRFFYKIDVCVADPNDCKKEQCPGTCENKEYRKAYTHKNQIFCPFCRYDEDKEYFTKCKARQTKTRKLNSDKLKEMKITRERHQAMVTDDYKQTKTLSPVEDNDPGAPIGGAQLIVSTNKNINNAGRFIRYRNTSEFKKYDSYFHKNKHIKINASALDGSKHIIKEKRSYPNKKLKGKIGKGCIHPWEGVKWVSWPIPDLNYDYNPEKFTNHNKKPNSYYEDFKKELSDKYFYNILKLSIKHNDKSKIVFISSRFFLDEMSFRDRVIKECNPEKVGNHYFKWLPPILNNTFTPFYYYPNSYDEKNKPTQWKEWIYDKTYLGKLISPPIKESIKKYYESTINKRQPPGCSKQEKIKERGKLKSKGPKKSEKKWLGLWQPDKKQYYPLSHWEAFQAPKEHLELKETHYNYSQENDLSGEVLGFLPTFNPKHQTSETTSFYHAGELSGALLTRKRPLKGVNKPFDGWKSGENKETILRAISDHIKKCYGWKSNTIKLKRVFKFTDNNIRTSKKIIPPNEQKTSPINLKNTKGKNKKFINEWAEDVKNLKAPEPQPKGEWYPANRTEDEGLSPYWKDPCWDKSKTKKCFKNSRCAPGTKKEYDQTHERILNIIKMNADAEKSKQEADKLLKMI